MVIGTGKMIHAMRDVKEKLFVGVPVPAPWRGTDRLIDVDEQLPVKARLFRRYGIVRLSHDICRARFPDEGPVNLIRKAIADKIHRDFVPNRTPDAPVRLLGEIRRRSPDLGARYAEHRGQPSTNRNSDSPQHGHLLYHILAL